MVHVIVPMSGSGERFKQAGYAQLKPLIQVDGEPMINHVVRMFDAPDTRFTFICNEVHLRETNLQEVLSLLNVEHQVKSIAPHKKGPVYAVAQCLEVLREDEETIVSYCDFSSYWCFSDFLSHTRARRAQGAIAAYKGFHPHMLGADNYAFIKDDRQWLLAIQEKKPFTDDRLSEYASNGVYYFAAGQLIERYFPLLLEEDIQVNGEYYVSMVYNLMVRDRLPVSIYEVQHMLQWGTPYDLVQYQQWSDYFAGLMTHKPAASDDPVDCCLIPMAGRGERFSREGYELPKPLIPVSGKPMVVQACNSLPAAKRYVFVTLAGHTVADELRDWFGETVSIVELSQVTEGQACTCAVGVERATPPIGSGDSLLIGACDNGIVYDATRFQALLDDKTIDCAAFSFRNNASARRNPQMYGWLKVQGDSGSGFPLVTDVSVKVPISARPEKDHAIVGAFYFRTAEVFMEAFLKLKQLDIRVNGEFYADSLVGVLVRAGRRCVAFEVDKYICFGTPDDLRTFEYWQSYFHKAAHHPYRYENDPFAHSTGPDSRVRERLEMSLGQPCN